EGPEQAALAHAIVKLAHALGMGTVAEGVEEPEQEAVLRAWGCTQGQGWRWSGALPAEDVGSWLTDRVVVIPEDSATARS
ncbi:MAG: EAL domain-containing protein, partial [Actinobacteria bacterium]|nr:EAL domain-containing protein [Actinomycetota bacterium]